MTGTTVGDRIEDSASRGRVLISGASIAGPALAYWLCRYGFDVTVVEKAAAVRRGGQPVDFKGHVQLFVLRRMGILEHLRSADVRDPDATIVNASGRPVGRIPGAFGAGQVNVPRGDLAALLYQRTREDCTYRFADSIAHLDDRHDGVRVRFASGRSDCYDIVIGADGMHSNTRRLVFGPEERYVTHLGAYYALADADVRDITGNRAQGSTAHPSHARPVVSYNKTGIMATVGATTPPVFFAFASPPLPPARDDGEIQKQQTATALAKGGWRIPQIVATLEHADSFYMDSISRAVVDDGWARGRVALVGDSAWGNALGGYGTGLALVGAYVLAGELAAANGDPTQAFASYEAAFRDYAAVSQKVNIARLMVPRTRFGIRARNALFTMLEVFAPLLRVLDRPADIISLEDYRRYETPPTPTTPPLPTSGEDAAERPWRRRETVVPSHTPVPVRAAMLCTIVVFVIGVSSATYVVSTGIVRGDDVVPLLIGQVINILAPVLLLVPIRSGSNLARCAFAVLAPIGVTLRSMGLAHSIGTGEVLTSALQATSIPLTVAAAVLLFHPKAHGFFRRHPHP